MPMMRLEQFTSTDKRELIRPVDISDLPMFKHCANDMVAVTPDYYRDVVSPLLMAHGYSTFCDYSVK